MFIFELINNLIIFEKAHGITFNEDGFPVFKKDMFYVGNVNDVFPYEHRHKATSEDIICFYEHDIYLHRKLTMKKLFDVSNELSKYKCFIGFDLSIFEDMPIHLEKFYILANLVIDIFFIINGNKMIPNIRIANIDYSYLFKEASFVSCGSLGCAYNSDIRNLNAKRINQYISSNPSQKIILYGSKIIDNKNILHIKSLAWRNKYE